MAHRNTGAGDDDCIRRGTSGEREGIIRVTRDVDELIFNCLALESRGRGGNRVGPAWNERSDAKASVGIAGQRPLLIRASIGDDDRRAANRVSVGVGDAAFDPRGDLLRGDGRRVEQGGTGEADYGRSQKILQFHRDISPFLDSERSVGSASHGGCSKPARTAQAGLL